jgi:tripartite-type tricarboxylate transporter receptor subunit TctC
MGEDVMGKISSARALAGGCLLLGLLAASLAPASAQNYPTRRITLVVPYTAGSGFDIVARTVGQKLSERWGQPVVIDNKPGASGTIGTEAVANASADGYTLLVSGGPHTIYPSLMKNLRFDSVTSFTPIGVTAAGVVALVVNPEALPVKSVPELIAAIKAKPGVYNFSSPGVGTLQHLGMELFKQQLGLDVLHVPYRGAAPAITDLITGQVQFTYLPVNSAQPQVQAGKLRMLAVASSKRTPLAPEVPSLAELGYPSLDFDLWFGFLGPANLPPAIVRKWDDELATINALPDVKDALQKQGLAPLSLDSAATGALIKRDIVRWRTVVEKAGLKPE